MVGLVERIKGRSSRIKAQRNAFVSKLVKLNETLSEALEGIDVWAQSGQESLEMIGPDDWVYGCLSFSNKGLEVVYKSTEDDFYEAVSQVPIEHKS